MIIRYDHSYITKMDNEMIARGYAKEDLFSIELNFEYTEDQKEENNRVAVSCTTEEWSKRCRQAALMRSQYMERVIEGLASEFVLYQFSDNGVKYDSTDWDLFFWCNDFYNTCHGSGLGGRDYSYITLNFNKRCPADHNIELCNHVLDYMKERFFNMENLCVTVKYDVTTFPDKIQKDANKVLHELDGTKFKMNGKDGRLIERNGKLYWMKKYAKRYGYLLSDSDVLRISWAEER